MKRRLNSNEAKRRSEYNIQSNAIKKRIVKINRLLNYAGKVKKHVYVNFYIEIQKFMRSQCRKIEKNW